MWEITKHFDFCYGHRVHTQELDAELSCNSACKCRHLHGHQGKLKVTLAGKELKNGMVTDFHHLNWLKVFIDDYFDHKMIMDFNDPYLLNIVAPLDFVDSDFYLHIHCADISVSQLSLAIIDDDVLREAALTPAEREVLEGLVVVDFVPTSENLAKFIFDWVSMRMAEHCKEEEITVQSVVFEETPKSSSTYTGEFYVR